MKFTGRIILALFLVGPAPASAAVCASWDASGQWYIRQSNGFTVGLDMKQEGNVVSGSAQWIALTGEGKVLGVTVKGEDPEINSGSLDGTIDGNRVNLKIYWTTNGQIGVYTGEIDSLGRIEGDTYDRQQPNSRATWFSSILLRCATPAVPPTSPAPVPKMPPTPSAEAVPNRAGAAELQTKPVIVADKPGVVIAKPNADEILVDRPGAAGRTPSAKCASGFVWRVARAEDLVCVTPVARKRIKQENADAANHVDPAGAYGPNTCLSGYVWRDAYDGDAVCVTPEARSLARQENAEGPSHHADDSDVFRAPR